MNELLIKSKKIYISDFIGFEIIKNKKEKLISCLIFKRKGENANFSYFIHIFPDFFEIIPFWEFKTAKKGIILTLKQNLTSSYIKNLELEKTLFVNKIQGLINLYKKILIISGIGFRFQLNYDSNLKIFIFAGFSHLHYFDIPKNIFCSLENSNKLIIESASKVDLGLFASKIKNVRPIEIFKGKGIKYENEIIKLKSYKKAK